MPKKGHDYTSVVTAPTCNERGYTTHTCIDCGHSYNDNYTRPYGHEYVATVVSPKCEEEGYTTHTCSFCGDSYDDAFVSAKGHNHVPVVTPPKCEEEGYTTYTCSDCGDSYVDDYIPPKGHGEGVWVSIEGVSEDGNPLEGYCCADCGEIVGVRQLVPYLLGDVNIDGIIDMKDYALVKRFCFDTAIIDPKYVDVPIEIEETLEEQPEINEPEIQ